MLAFPAATVEVYPAEAPWLDARRASIGSSDSCGLWDAVPKGHEGVISEKLGLDPPFEDFTDAGDEKEAGSTLEPCIVEWLGKRIAAPVRRLRWTIARSIEMPWMTASLDGIVLDGAGEAVAVIEAKTTKRMIEWDPDLIRWPSINWDRGERPLRWVVQVQHQLAVTGLKRAYLAVLIGGELKLRYDTIERNEEFIRRHRDRCARVWREIEAQRGLSGAAGGRENG